MICSNHCQREISHARIQHFAENKVDDGDERVKTKNTSFFDEVDERMKRDSPAQYQLFLESKAKWESKWKLLEERNVQSRRRVVVRGREASMLVDSSTSTSSTKTDELPTTGNHGRQVHGLLPTADRIVLSASKTSHTTKDDRTTASSTNDTTLPSWDQTIMKSIHQPITLTSSNNDVSNKKGGVFSSISKNALMIKSANVNIPLSELFPTLYATDSPAKELTPQKHFDPIMTFDPDDFEAYEQAMTAVFAEDGTIKAISKFERKMADKDSAKWIVQKVKEWLLNKQRIVEPKVMKGRWNNVDEAWKNAKWMTGLSQSEPINEESEAASDTMFTSELKLQQQLFLSLLQDKELGFIPNSDGEILPVHLDDVPGTRLDPTLFYEVTQHYIGALGRYCARRARSTPMVVAWWKVKESGLLLRKDVTANFLYVCSTMGVADSIGMSSRAGAYSTDKKQENGRENTTEIEQSRFLIPEEVATYHDLSSKPTESSISLRVKALASKGNAKSAEELVEAFKASDPSCIHLFPCILCCLLIYFLIQHRNLSKLMDALMARW